MESRKGEQFIPPIYNISTPEIESLSNYQEDEIVNVSTIEDCIQIQQNRKQLIRRFKLLAKQYQCALDEAKQLSEEKERILNEIKTIQKKTERLDQFLDEVHNE